MEQKMWTVGFRYNWRKMEAAARDRAGNGAEWYVVCGPLGAARHKSIDRLGCRSEERMTVA